MKAVVLGAGAEARIAAAYLAKSGVEVTIVGRTGAEARLRHGWIPPRIADDLKLPADPNPIPPFSLRDKEGSPSADDRGIASMSGNAPPSSHEHKTNPAPSGQGSGQTWGQPQPWASTILADGARLDFTRDVEATADALRSISPRDAARWPRFCDRMHAFARVLEDLYTAPPPDPTTHAGSGLVAFARAALRVRRLGRADMTALIRLLPMSAADLFDAWFESDALKGVLGVQAVRHLAQGPRSGGTAFNFLHHHVGCARGVFRQPLWDEQTVLGALPDLHRVDDDAVRIELRESTVAGVALRGGDTLPADVVVSAIDPERTLTVLLDPAWLDPELVRSIRNVRSRGVAATVTFTLDAAPGFSTLVVAPSLDAIERAYDDSKYGRVSRDPCIEAQHIGASGDGAHRVRAHVQYVPYRLREGAWADAHRDAIAACVRDAVERAAPGFAARVRAASVATPADLERSCGLPQGQPYHAELALDQVFWMRPVPALAGYRSPIRGLYLCGPAMHPGGNVIGAAGANAASVILGDVKNKKLR